MQTVINLVVLNKRCESYFDGENAFAPFAHGSVETVAAAIAEHGAAKIKVQARTSSDPENAACDLVTYNRRLQKLAAACGYRAEPLTGCSLVRSTMVKE